MNPPTNPDWLDEALRETPRYIDDAGFTARVVAALPPARSKLAWKRHAILGAVTAVALAVGLVVLPGGRFVVDCVVELARARTLDPALILPAIFVALGLGACLLPVATER
jgi:hypothetical protein